MKQSYWRSRVYRSLRKAMTCSRATEGKPARNASIVSPAATQSSRVCTGTRVPRKTAAPPITSESRLTTDVFMALKLCPRKCQEKRCPRTRQGTISVFLFCTISIRISQAKSGCQIRRVAQVYVTSATSTSYSAHADRAKLDEAMDTKKSDIGSALIEGMENAVVRPHGRKRRLQNRSHAGPARSRCVRLNRASLQFDSSALDDQRSRSYGVRERAGMA